MMKTRSQFSPISSSRSAGKALLILVVLIWLSWALRLYRLDAKSIWSDEGLSIYRARQSFAVNLTNQIVIQDVVTKDTQPPLYFILLHFLRLVAGESEFALRFLSVSFASVIVPLLYIMGKRLASSQVGLIASFWGALSPTYLWYAQEIRMYTMLVAISLFSSYALLRVLSDSTSRRRSRIAWFIAYLLGTGAMIYTHYSGFFLLLLQGLLLAAFAIRSGRWHMIGLVAAAAAAALPLIPFIWRRLSAGVERDYSFVRLPVILRDLLNGFSVGISADPAQVWWLNALGLFVLFIGLASLRRDGIWGRWGKTLFLLGYLLVPTLTLYAASYIKPMYMGVRHLLIISPAYYVGTAAGFASLTGLNGHGRRRTWPVAILTALLLVGGNIYATNNYFYSERYIKDDLRSLVLYIRQRFRSGDLLILNDAVVGKAFEYYAPDMPWTALPRHGQLADAETIRACQDLANTYERIWFVYGPPSTYYDPEGLVRTWLEENLFKLDFHRFPGFGVEVGTYCYATRSPILEQLPLLPTMAKPKQSDSTAPLSLLRYDLPTEPTPSGDALVVTFYWWLSRPADADYKMSLRLHDPEGGHWAQNDSEPFYFFPTTKWPPERVIRHAHELLLPPGTPPGRYQLELRVYRADTGELLNVSRPDGTSFGEQIALGEAEVSAAVRLVNMWELPPHYKVNADFNGEITLLAHTWWERPYSPGDILHLDFYWRAEKAITRDYQMRLQLLATDKQVVTEISTAPTLATYPTSSWRAGEVLRGQCNLTLPTSLAAGTYHLRLQLYDPTTGEPLCVRKGWLLMPNFALGCSSFLRLPSLTVEVSPAPGL